MTENNAFKKAVRAYAEAHNVPYAQARRAVTQEALALLDKMAGGAQPQRLLTIQQEMREDFQMPYPFSIFEHGGYVDNQQFWNGDPWVLIGFEDRSPEAMAAAAQGTWDRPGAATSH